MKAKSKIFKGIEYVQLSELPLEQQAVLNQTLDKNTIIKILMGGKIANDCIQYKDYDHWFESTFSHHRSRKIPNNTTPSTILPNVLLAK